MSLIPPKDNSTTKKPAAKRVPRRPRGTLDIGPKLEDTPNPPTEPVPEPEPEPRKTAKPRSGTLESRLNEAFASVSILPSFAGDQYSSFILASRSGPFCHNLAELAKVNPRIKRMLEGMLDGGAYGGVMFSGAAIALPIAWAYGLLPAPPIDPFSAFYPSLPPGVVPRSAVRSGQSSQGGRVATTPSGNGDAPTRAARSAPVNEDTPVGVVTVKPGAHPPVPPAAM